MTENKIDRTNLKRQAQRTESYSILVSKRRTNFTTDAIHFGKPRLDNATDRLRNPEYFNTQITELQEENKNVYNEPGSSPTSSSSDSSQDFHPKLCRNWRPVQNSCQQFEIDTSPVMTRSATRKYATVGAIFNKVNLEQELRIKKQWPVSVGCTPPTLSSSSSSSSQLTNVMSRSLNFVMSFCKYATFYKNEKTQEEQDTSVGFELDKSVNFIDLSPYLVQGPIIDNENEQTQITLHLTDGLLSHQFINIISINNEEESQALVIQENDNELETITLHSGETFVLDNKYVPHSNSVFVNPHGVKSRKMFSSITHEDPMMAVHNDHTYAMRYSDNVHTIKPLVNETHESNNQDQGESIFQNALKDLLFNTVILKCLICGETPQEMIQLLESAYRS